MAKQRALALTKGKELFERARSQLTDRVEFRDLAPGVDVPCFAPQAATLLTIDGIMARWPFDHVVATSESDVAFAGLLRSRYGLAGMGYDAALVATNKWRMKQAVQPFHPTAEGWLSGDFLERRGSRPDAVVIKPLSGSSARGVRRLPLDAALRLLEDSDELFLVEQALDASAELHCDGLVRGGRLEWVIASVYDRPVLGATGTRASIHLPRSDPRGARAIAATQNVLHAMPVPDFVFHLELLECEGSLVFGEIGLRPAGGGVAESIARSYGSDIWLEFVGIQVGIEQRLSPLPRQREDACAVVGVVLPPNGGAGRPEKALEHPRVTGTAPGDLQPGCLPENSCHFSHLLFVERLERPEIRSLLRELELAGAEAV